MFPEIVPVFLDEMIKLGFTSARFGLMSVVRNNQKFY